MTTPTREQVIQAAQAVGVPDIWLATMTDLAFEYLGKMLQAAHAAGRAQGLGEAAAFVGPELQTADGERSLAAAIESLKEQR